MSQGRGVYFDGTDDYLEIFGLELHVEDAISTAFWTNTIHKLHGTHIASTDTDHTFVLNH